MITARKAQGTFTVRLEPRELVANEEPTLGRLLIDKQFTGDLDAVSKGQMLSAMTAVEGSARYVALERVEGTLHGRRGSFVLQHSGTMDRGTGSLTISVVPDSGAGELVGLMGSMNIVIVDNNHTYEFDYSLPQVPGAAT